MKGGEQPVGPWKKGEAQNRLSGILLAAVVLVVQLAQTMPAYAGQADNRSLKNENVETEEITFKPEESGASRDSVLTGSIKVELISVELLAGGIEFQVNTDIPFSADDPGAQIQGPDIHVANHSVVPVKLEISQVAEVGEEDVVFSTRFSEQVEQTFRLVDKPKRGAVTLSEDGSAEFVYTPYENKTGKDSFTYVAVDAVGNTSAPATVKIKIDKSSTKVTYADMAGVPSYKAAIRLAEEGIFVGECMGGQYFFNPDAPVSRSEFVAMAMKTVGMDALSDVTTTGFADDVAIPTWAKPYAASALKSGVIQGLSLIHI